MRTCVLLTTLFVLLLPCSANAVDRVYTFLQPAEFEASIYGFSGIITTDGSLGTFSDTSFIKDWSLTLFTPAGDGNSMEMFTSATGAIGVNLGGLELFSVTETDISFLNTGSSDAGYFAIGDLVEAYLVYHGPTQLDTGRVRVIDGSDGISDSVLFGNLSALPIATGGVAVPEPSTGVLGALASIGLLLRWRRQS